jgi:hypothetical protein
MTLEECLEKQQEVNNLIVENLKGWKITPDQMKDILSGITNADPRQFAKKQQGMLQGAVMSDEMVRLNYELAKGVATLSFEDYQKYIVASFEAQADLGMRMSEVTQSAFSEAFQSSLLYRVGHLFGGGES